MAQKIRRGLFKLLPVSVAVLMIFFFAIGIWQNLPVRVVRAAAPTMTAATADTDSDGTVDRVTLTFSEATDVDDTGGAGDGLGSLALTSGCTIANGDYTINGLLTLNLTLTGCTAGNTSITPTVPYTAV